MLVEPGLLSAGVDAIAWLLAAVALGAALVAAPWRAWLGDRERQWAWLGSLALVLAVWSMKAGLTPGLSVRFLLVPALALMHGWALAVVGAALVLGVLGATGQAAWASFGPNLLCMAVVPAVFVAWLHERVHARLPLNYFVYFFVTVFVGSALAYNLAGLTRIALLATSGSLDEAHAGPEYFAILPLMSFGEAFVNGMVMAMLVVYRPRWVMSFDDRLYLARKGDRG